jgi:undecaprenyl phosphate-alpha-L-ara4FN deformylase
MSVALKVDVNTLRGTLEGVPALLRLFDAYRVRATFLFALGPDHRGRALRRIIRPGVLRDLRRTRLVRDHALKPLLYGTLLPGPNIGRQGRAAMRACAEAGHEIGIHGYDCIKWQDLVAWRAADWTRVEMDKAAAAYADVFGRPAEIHGAAGWQINPYVLELEGKMGFIYASDTRGRSAFYPVLQGVRSTCPQIPTTLPTLEELVGRDGATVDNVHQFVYAESQYVVPQGHVYTLQAEVEGIRLLPAMEKLLVMWGAASGGVGPLEDVYGSLDLSRLPHHLVGWGQVPGRSGYLAMQGQQAPS